MTGLTVTERRAVKVLSDAIADTQAVIASLRAADRQGLGASGDAVRASVQSLFAVGGCLRAELGRLLVNQALDSRESFKRLPDSTPAESGTVPSPQATTKESFRDTNRITTGDE